jgi:hypothetical protein
MKLYKTTLHEEQNSTREIIVPSICKFFIFLLRYSVTYILSPFDISSSRRIQRQLPTTGSPALHLRPASSTTSLLTGQGREKAQQPSIKIKKTAKIQCAERERERERERETMTL